MENFLVRAFVGGVGIALITGPLGCFIVWRRLSYFGDTLAHSALLGIAIAVLLGQDYSLGALLMCIVVASLLGLLQQQKALSNDTLLGLIAHSSLAAGMVLIAFVEGFRFDLVSLLFGDILAMSQLGILWIYTSGLIIAGLLWFFWRPLLAITVHQDLAEVEGIKVVGLQFLLMILIAIVIATAMKIVGILLITALMIIPAASARRFATNPEQMALAASLFGV